MKTSLTTIIPASIVICFLLILSCGDDDGGGGGDDRSPQEIATDSLTSGTWSLANGGSITLDGSDVTDLYTGLTARFTFNAMATNTYNTTNSGGPNGQNRLFSPSGTWDWANGTTNNSIDLDDDEKSTLTIVTLNNSTFRFRFTQLVDASGTAAGTDGLAGAYDVTLTK